MLPSHKAIYWFLTKLHSIFDGATSGFYPGKATGWGTEIFLILALNQPFYYHLWRMRLVLCTTASPLAREAWLDEHTKTTATGLRLCCFRLLWKPKWPSPALCLKPLAGRMTIFLKGQTQPLGGRGASHQPAIWFLFLYPSGVCLGCKFLDSVCPGCTAPLCFAKAPGRWLPRSYSIWFLLPWEG